MRILHAIDRTDAAAGGPVENVRQFATALAPLGVSIDLVSMDDPTGDWLADFPLTIHAMGPGAGTIGRAPKMDEWLRVHGKEYDLIVVDGVWRYNALAVWKTRKAHGRPYVVFTHGMLDPWFRKNYPRKHLAKQVYWILSLYRIMRDAKAILYTCEEERRVAQNAFVPWGPFRERIVTLGTGGSPYDLDEARKEFLAAYPALAGSRNLLYLSRIHEKKGCDLLIRSFAPQARRFPELTLIMAGPDQTGWGKDLQKLADDLGVADRIVWTGMIEKRMKWGAYATAEAFVLPSHQENFGIVVAEALACGVPTLISNKVNIWREIEADGAGLVAEDDQPGTDALLERWMALKPDERSAMRGKARECFDKRFEIGAAASALLAAYRSVTGA